jgi:hypothetical protein
VSLDDDFDATAQRHVKGLLRAFERYLVQKYGLEEVPGLTPMQKAERFTEEFNRRLAAADDASGVPSARATSR